MHSLFEKTSRTQGATTVSVALCKLLMVFTKTKKDLRSAYRYISHLVQFGLELVSTRMLSHRPIYIRLNIY